MNKSAFTIDVEDGISIAMRDYFNVIMDPTERVTTNTRNLLELLDRFQVKATFFILGEIAKHYPDLVKTISRQGHEIGVHGYSHKQYFLLTPEEVRLEISNTKALLEDITGEQVLGHRAPSFSITSSTSWALPVIKEAGFTYDSSIVPAKTRRYGWPEFKKEIVSLEFSNGDTLLEIPLSVYDFFGKTFPVGGGGYLKLTPFCITNYFFSRIQKQRIGMIYIHPYEIDTERYPDFFHQAASRSGLLTQIKVNTFRINKRTVLSKLERLLSIYRFTSIKEIIKDFEMVLLEKVKINTH